MTNETRSTLSALYNSLAPAQNSAGSSNGNGGGSGSASSRRTSPLEDYYNEKRQKQAIEKANQIINSDILHGGTTRPFSSTQTTFSPTSLRRRLTRISLLARPSPA